MGSGETPDLFGHDQRWQSVLDPAQDAGSDVRLCPGALSKNSADVLFQKLSDQVPWQQKAITVYGKQHLQPRLVAWYGDTCATYRYSGQTMEPLPWITPLTALREFCRSMTDHPFNSVLCNFYRDGQDAMGWHADNEAELGPSPVIASITLGTPRRFDLRHRVSGETHKLELPHGSLLVMAGRTQQEWVHQVPRTKRVNGPRINLTFRYINLPPR